MNGQAPDPNGSLQLVRCAALGVLAHGGPKVNRQRADQRHGQNRGERRQADLDVPPNLTDYYASASSIQAAANAANRKEAGTNEKVLALGLTLLPDAYQLHQALGRLQAGRGDAPAAIRSYETALQLNPKKTPIHVRDFETTTTALAALR